MCRLVLGLASEFRWNMFCCLECNQSVLRLVLRERRLTRMSETLKPIDRLFFVYNAESGVLHSVVDSAKKLLSINGCALCSLTHSMVGEKSEWKDCRESIGVPVEYVHRNELTPAMRELVGGKLPTVVAEAAGELVMLLEPEVIARCQGSIGDLKGRLRTHATMRGLSFSWSLPLEGASPARLSSGPAYNRLRK
jgi:hypothetical protein